MRNNKNKISSLIIKELFDSISDDEKKELQEWQKEDNKNSNLIDRIHDVSNFNLREKEMSAFNSEKAWDKFQQSSINNNKTNRFKNLFFKYAAVLVFAIMVGAAFYFVFDDKSGNTDFVASNIKPGKQKAELILNNGNKIELENDEDLSILESSGIVIEKRKSLLDYNKIKSQNTKIIYNTIKTPKGGKYKLRLADGTLVFINAMSELKFPVFFKGKTREVELVKGEAFFDVVRNEKLPFIVKTGGGNRVKVLGTAFNVKFYNDDDNITTTLVRGKVLFVARNGKEAVLKPGYQSVLNLSNKELVVNKVDVNLYTGWKDDVFIFKNERLEDIMKTLIRWYDAEVVYANEEVKDIRFGGKINTNEKIESILELIELTNKIDVKINDKTIIINRKK
jgi:ferric-dicitrate binding protein FerR (iron transport regulator)